MKAAALMVFTVSYAGIRIKVRVLPTVRDVHREYEARHVDGRALRLSGKYVEAYCVSKDSLLARHSSEIVLPADGQLDELIPHEVTHAVIHKKRTVHFLQEEPTAMAIGILSARIARKISRGVVYE